MNLGSISATIPRTVTTRRPRSPAVITSGSSARSEAPLPSSSSPSRGKSRTFRGSPRSSREAPEPVSVRMTPYPALPHPKISPSLKAISSFDSDLIPAVCPITSVQSVSAKASRTPGLTSRRK